MSKRRVVVTGIGPVTPVGAGKDAFWLAVAEGTSGTKKLQELPGDFPVQSLRSQIVAQVPSCFFSPEELGSVQSRQFLLGRKAMKLAVEDASLKTTERGPCGVVLGNAVGGTAPMEATFLAMERSGSLSPESAPKDLPDQFSFHSLTDEVAAMVSSDGPVLTITTGCTAGLDAIGLAFQLVQSGSMDVALTGSAEAPITPVVYAAFDVIGALSKQNGNPETASRPFDRRRDGFVLGEGAAILVLEELQHARRRQARIYCEITGYASCSNAYHMTDLPEDGAALAECMQMVLDDASMRPQEVDHVNAHGSSTPQNDICETNAIKSVLGGHAYNITVNSLKAMVGHALAASNAIEIAACALSLQAGRVFPTINLDAPGEGCDLDYIPNTGRRSKARNVIKLSNGFSGIHSAMVLEQLR
jgi:3-oxoacyl-(acyl-carrier-protein) synthase